jgi:hypothetical protein
MADDVPLTGAVRPPKNPDQDDQECRPAFVAECLTYIPRTGAQNCHRWRFFYNLLSVGMMPEGPQDISGVLVTWSEGNEEALTAARHRMRLDVPTQYSRPRQSLHYEGSEPK